MNSEQSKAFGDLESPICDLVDMAEVCDTLMEDYQENARAAAGLSVSARLAIPQLERSRDLVSFTVLQVSILARGLEGKILR
jgi:hypothetical protein